MCTYRFVSDYGYGDKTWLARGLSLKEALALYTKERPGHGLKTHDDVYWMDTVGIYYIEVDNQDDQEDWDWLDS